MTRARPLWMLSVALVLACTGTTHSGEKPPQPLPAPVDEVNPFMGTAGFAFMFASAFAGALAPNGLIKVGPDTFGDFGTINFLHYGGYWHDDSVVQAFTHMHLHGTGASDYGIIGVMPLTDWDATKTSVEHYQSPMDKASEHASPGYYDVTLLNGPVRVELTATPHVAHHRFTFPAGRPAQVVIDLDKHLSGGVITSAEMTATSSGNAITGKLHHIGGMSDGFGGYDVWFEIRFKQAWTSTQVWNAAGGATEGASISGTKVGMVLEFPAASAVEMLVAVSLVSADGARANLATEMPSSFDFEGTLQRTRDAWSTRLNRITVEGGTDAQRRLFYSSLYHAFLMPTGVGDADGSYRAVDGSIQAATGFRYVSDLSLWDTYRTLNPLLSLAFPDDARDVAQSLLSMAEHGGFFPRWPIATGEAGTMLGSSAEVAVADAVVKGVPGIDAENAYARLRAAAMDVVAPAGGRGGRNEVERYMQFGYVPTTGGRSVSLTVEYAHDDYALSNLARFLGHNDDADALAARAHSWRALVDPSVGGFPRGKREDGTWDTLPFQPEDFSEYFAEATSWQTLFGAPHDVEGLMLVLGGREAAVEKLRVFCQNGRDEFEAPRDDPLAFGTFMHPWLWPSNEPSLHIPYMFAQLGRPDLTQQWVTWMRRNYFSDEPAGVPGNDDGGTMGAWVVFTALGFYPVPGGTEYVVGTPLFPRAHLKVTGGEFTVEAVGVSDENVYVQRATLNGVELTEPRFQHADLHAGGVLRLEMGPSPSGWGVLH